MPISPIDTGRYGSEEMKQIFEDKNRYQKLLDVEAVAAQTLAELGYIPRETAKIIKEKASTSIVKPFRIKEIEKEIQHEMMAIVKALSEQCGEHGGYVHFGLTSSDALDTALTLQIKEAIEVTERKLKKLLEIFLKKAEKYKELTMIGRTHGQHAAPITLGFKFAVYAYEFYRHLERLREAKPRILIGKLSGAVGTFAALGKKGPIVQRETLKKLGIKEPLITTQILQRDRHAELIFILALIASSLDKLATEIRNLQRTEINEIAEPFAEKQVGSSTMPHKRNPYRCERMTSLARMIRANVQTSLENIVILHERDLTHSANERFIIPQTFILLDEMLSTMIKVIRNIQVNREKIRENLQLTKGLVLSERVMMTLTRKGMNRQRAHELVRKLALQAIKENRPFEEVLLKEREVTEKITPKEIEKLLNPKTYTGLAAQITTKTISEIKRRIKLI